MSRYIVDTFTSASVPANSTLTFARSLPNQSVNFMKIKVEPSATGDASCVRLFAKSDYDPEYMVYNSNEFLGDFIDPISDDGAAITEINEGYLFPYDEADGLKYIYFKIYNDSSSARTYDIQITYEFAGTYSPRAAVSAGTFTNFADQDFWVPWYGWGIGSLYQISWNGAGSMKFESLATTFGIDNMHHGLMSRFWVVPDSNGLIQLRTRWEDCKGNQDTWYQAHMAFGTMLCYRNGTPLGMGMTCAAVTSTAQYAVGPIQDSIIGHVMSSYDSAFDKVYSSVTDPFTFENAFQIGRAQRVNGKINYQGMDFTGCWISMNDETAVDMSAFTSGNPPYFDAANVIEPVCVWLGIKHSTKLQTGNQVVLTEFEVLKGTIFKN